MLHIGRYWEGRRNFSCNGGSESSGPADGTIVLDITGVGNIYSVVIRCTVSCGIDGPDRGIASFSVVGTTIQNYTWNWDENLCNNVSNNPTIPCDHGDPCPTTEQGEGIIIDELELEFYVTHKNCTSACVGTKFWLRQD